MQKKTKLKKKPERISVKLTRYVAKCIREEIKPNKVTTYNWLANVAIKAVRDFDTGQK